MDGRAELLKWPLSRVSDADVVVRVSVSLLAPALNVLQMPNY